MNSTEVSALENCIDNDMLLSEVKTHKVWGWDMVQFGHIECGAIVEYPGGDI